MRSSVSIILFFLLSGLFLTLLLGAIERSRKLLALAGVFLAAVVCIIVILTPVQLPRLAWWRDNEESKVETVSDSTTTSVIRDTTTTTSMGAPSTPTSMAGAATTTSLMSPATTTSLMSPATTAAGHTVTTFEATTTTEPPLDGPF